MHTELFPCPGSCEWCCNERRGRVWTSLQDNDFIPSDLHLGVELLDHVNVLFLIFWATSTLFSTVAAPIYIPTKSAQEFSFQEALFECKSSTVAIWRQKAPLFHHLLNELHVPWTSPMEKGLVPSETEHKPLEKCWEEEKRSLADRPGKPAVQAVMGIRGWACWFSNYRAGFWAQHLIPWKCKDPLPTCLPWAEQHPFCLQSFSYLAVTGFYSQNKVVLNFSVLKTQHYPVPDAKNHCRQQAKSSSKKLEENIL